MTTVSMKAFNSLDDSPLRELLRTVTYRPGWSFEIEKGGAVDVLVIQAEVIDTDDHRKLISLNFGVSIPSFVRPDFDWTRWIFDQIMSLERHEAQEFFKINGVKVYDPHA